MMTINRPVLFKWYRRFSLPLLDPSRRQVTVSALADSVICLEAGHMALYLVRRSLCVAAHSFQPPFKPLRNAELWDSGRVGS